MTNPETVNGKPINGEISWVVLISAPASAASGKTQREDLNVDSIDVYADQRGGVAMLNDGPHGHS